jgi:nucleoporin GLE1
MAVEFDLRLSISDRDFNERLDQAAAERAKLHEQQLARAAEEHSKVIKGAELEIQRLQLEEEQARERRIHAQQQEVERLKREQAQEAAEAQRVLLEAKLRDAEAARQAAEQQRKIQDADARIKEQSAAAEKHKKEKDEADRRAKMAADAAAKAPVLQQSHPLQPPPATALRPPAAPTAMTTPTASTGAPATNFEPNHAQYLAMHAYMKVFRKSFVQEHGGKGSTSPLKPILGEARREIRGRLGQVTTVRADSQRIINTIRTNCLIPALEFKGPTVDIRPYLISKDIPPLKNEADAQYPAYLLYLFMCFMKLTLKQFKAQASGTDTRILQEVGLIAASLLGDKKYMWLGTIPLSDLFVAKLHHNCPLLFGVRGTMDTAQGRIRLGLIPYKGQEPTEKEYRETMRGLGAGYAAMSLRSFTGASPAIPMAEYWRAVVSICNTPTEDLWPGHFSVLHGLLGDYHTKFVQHYGVQAAAVLRRAVVDLPRRAPPRCKDTAGTVAVLPLNWKMVGWTLE